MLAGCGRSKRRKPNSGKPTSRRAGRPPNKKESMDIAVRIYQFAELVADSQHAEAGDALTDWVGDDDSSQLRAHYLATAAPLLAMGLIRKHFPVDMEPDDLWVLEHAKSVSEDALQDDIHARAMC